MKKTVYKTITAALTFFILFTAGCDLDPPLPVSPLPRLPAPIPLAVLEWISIPMETADPLNNTLPLGWSPSVYRGHTPCPSFTENTPVFTWPVDGPGGKSGARVSVTGAIIHSYTGHLGGNSGDGDAKWSFQPITLLQGRDYVFSSWYRSNVDTMVVLAVDFGAGRTRGFYRLPYAPASEVWTEYKTTFTMPKHGEKVTIYHILQTNGWLEISGYRFGLFNPIGFNQGIVTITFDDGWEINYDTALPVMQQFGFKSDQFLTVQFIGDNPGGPTWSKSRIQMFINSGHEIGSHSMTHPYLTALPPQRVIDEIADSRRFLEDFFDVTVRHFATPYGVYNTFVNDTVMRNYDTHITVDTGFNSMNNLNPRQLKRMCILNDTPIEEFEWWVNKAREERLWLILLYHRVYRDNNDPGRDHTTLARFKEQMEAIRRSGIQVLTMTEAVMAITGQ